jgi:hypothetical protein
MPWHLVDPVQCLIGQRDHSKLSRSGPVGEGNKAAITINRLVQNPRWKCVQKDGSRSAAACLRPSHTA